MATLVFVHGTGVRLETFRSTDKKIREGLAHAFKTRPAPHLVPCLWGNSVGAHMRLSGRSVPGYKDAGGGQRSTPDLWEILSYDPLFELRALGAEEAVGAVEPSAYDAAVRSLPGADAGSALTAAQVGDEAFNAARSLLRGHTAYGAAVEAAQGELQLNPIVARALVAALIYAAPSGHPLRSDPALRDMVVNALIQDLGGAGFGIFDWTRALFGVASFLGVSDWLVHRRGRITDIILPALADVVLYQGRGQEVRNFIQEKVQEALNNPPVVVMAHSLGGIACVDLLAMNPDLCGKDKVKALVTVGSQSSLLYEMGALQSIPYGHAIPDNFPAWLNVYDQRDFLSSIGQRQRRQR